MSNPFQERELGRYCSVIEKHDEPGVDVNFLVKYILPDLRLLQSTITADQAKTLLLLYRQLSKPRSV